MYHRNSVLRGNNQTLLFAFLCLQIIIAAKRADVSSSTEQSFHAIARALVDGGADMLLLACTELSVLARSLDTGVPVIDTLSILADAFVDSGLGPSPDTTVV